MKRLRYCGLAVETTAGAKSNDGSFTVRAILLRVYLRVERIYLCVCRLLLDPDARFDMKSPIGMPEV